MIHELFIATQVAVPTAPPALDFAPPLLVSTGAGFLPTGIAAGDLDGDGLVEILTADSFAATVTVLYGLGGGDFLPKVLTPGGGEPRDVTVGDVSGDGVPDVVASLRSGPATTDGVVAGEPGIEVQQFAQLFFLFRPGVGLRINPLRQGLIKRHVLGRNGSGFLFGFSVLLLFLSVTGEKKNGT